MSEKKKNNILTQKIKSDSLIEKIRRRAEALRYGEMTLSLKIHDGYVKEVTLHHGSESWRAD